MGVLVSNIVADVQVRVSHQRRLLHEVGHRIFVTRRGPIQTRFVRRSGRVRSGPFFPVSLGVVDGPEQPQSVAPCSSLDGGPLRAHYLSSYPSSIVALDKPDAIHT